jgi:hypothetical protein
MPEPSAFDYAVFRVVPHPEREEFVNIGVILHCPAQRFLAARINKDFARPQALSPDIDLQMLREQLDLIPVICAGGKEAGALGELSQPERFRWLTSPRSTTIQVSPVHGGITDDAQSALDDLYERLVL